MDTDGPFKPKTSDKGLNAAGDKSNVSLFQVTDPVAGIYQLLTPEQCPIQAWETLANAAFNTWHT